MNVWLTTDTHFNHDNIATYCDRPADFTDRIIKRWQEVVKPEDLILHLGDVIIGNRRRLEDIMPHLPGRKTLIRGNHDRQHSNTWWMEHGFAFACDGLVFRNVWLTHEPSASLASGCEINVHGHLHNFKIDHHHKDFKPKPFHRLLAIEYIDYRPVEFDKFIGNPKKYNADIYDQYERAKLVEKLIL